MFIDSVHLCISLFISKFTRGKKRKYFSILFLRKKKQEKTRKNKQTNKLNQIAQTTSIDFVTIINSIIYNWKQINYN